MRRLPTRLALALLLGASGACSIAHLAHLPATGGEIRVRTRPGGHYLRTEAGGVGVLRLVDCPQPAHDHAGEAHAVPGHPTIARDADGDALEVAADAVPPGTRLKIVRHGGRPYRWVTAHHGHAAHYALTIDLRGCTLRPDLTVVHWTGHRWEDMGGLPGTPGDSTITTQLPHLSIYAVAGS
jgi:hypothetical protein